jgi:hypothetical protein
MKIALISMILAGVALGALPAWATGAKHPEPPRKEAGETPAREAPSRGLSGLLHASPDRVKARLGDPAIARAEGKGAFWTYRAPRCALYIFFKDEGGLKVSGAAAGPRKRGVPYPDLEVCLAELEQAQGGGQ